MAHAEAELNAAFNRGSDARLAGIPLVENPYLGVAGGMGLECFRLWRHGWLHCSRCFGIDVTPRPPLPPVNGAAVNKRQLPSKRVDLQTLARAVNVGRIA
jgi:hypothetical protein